MKIWAAIAWLILSLQVFSQVVSQEQLLKNLQPTISRQLEKQAVLVSWEKPADYSPVAYNVYYGSAPKSYTFFQQLPVASGPLSPENTRVVLKRLGTGLAYYFVVTAVDANGVESERSDEVLFHGGYMKSARRVPQNVILNFVSHTGWIINIGYSDNGRHWRLYRSITNPAPQYEYIAPDSKGKRLYYLIPQKILSLAPSVFVESPQTLLLTLPEETLDGPTKVGIVKE